MTASEYDVQVATNSWIPEDFPEVNKNFAEKELYDNLTQDSSFGGGLPMLDSFELIKRSQSIGHFKEVRNFLKEAYDTTFSGDSLFFIGKIAAASLKNNSAPATADFELREKKSWEIYMNVIKNGIEHLSETEMDIIEELAFSCPFEKGDGVYVARELYNMVSDFPTYFEDRIVCSQPEYYKNFEERSDNVDPVVAEEESDLQTFTLRSHPNPTTGKFQIDFGVENKPVDFQLFDPMGRIIIKEDDISGKFDLTRFPDGLYTFIVGLSDGRNLVGKVVKISH